MSIQIKSLVCPQCGSGRCSKVAGSPSLYACDNCGAEFVLSDSNAPKEVHVVHSMDQGQFNSLKNVKFMIAGAAAVFLLIMLAPTLIGWFKTAKPLAAPSYGRLQASTVYQTHAKDINVVRVMESGNEKTDVYQVLINSLESGKKLSEPQRFEFQRNTQSQYPQLAQFSDGNIYLLLNGQKFLRLDRGSAQFVSLDNELVNRFPKELSMGIAKLEFGTQAYPDSLEVTNNAGERFSAYWVTSEIMAYGESNSRFRSRPFASYTESQKHYGFASLRGLKNMSTSAEVLVRYEQKVHAGQYNNRPNIALYAINDELAASRSSPLTPVTPEWGVDPSALQSMGVIQLTPVAPVEKRFRSNVLASNDKRVLIVFNTTPVTDQGRVLQLIDVADGHVVWSRTVEQLPQITRSGTYLAADALPSGFYITSDNSTPSLLIDNEGAIVHDFSGKKS